MKLIKPCRVLLKKCPEPVYVNSETSEDSMGTRASENEPAPVNTNDALIENEKDKKNDSETKKQKKNEIIFTGFQNETQTGTENLQNDNSIASNVLTETCEDDCNDLASEIQLTNDENITKANCDKSRHLVLKEKISFRTGKVVFATLKPKATKKNSSLIYYAGIIVDGQDCYLKKPKENCAWVYWFLTKNVSMVPTENIIDFAPNLMDVKKTIEKKVNAKYRHRHIEALGEAVDVFAARWNRVFSKNSFNKACLQFLKEHEKSARHDDYAERRMPDTVAANLKRIQNINKKNVDKFIKYKKQEAAKPMETRTSRRKSEWTVQFKNFDKSQALLRRKKHLVNGKPWYESTPTCEPFNVAEMCLPVMQENPPSIMPKGDKQAIRVLSLFDGIGCGILALKQLGIEIEAYYVSEIDQGAITIMNIHHGGSGVIHHLGNVKSITEEILKQISPINLLIGGSPCNDLSMVNHSRKGLHNNDGTGVLFFQYYRILTLLQMMNNKIGVDLYWLYENVAQMEKNDRESITQFLGISGVVIDAANYSPQKRSRLFWGNIPGLQDIPNEDPSQTARRNLQSVLTPNCKRMATVPCSSTITTNPVTINQEVLMGDKMGPLWINELEQLFGLPEHYTDYGLSLQDRQCLIGRAWSVPVICKILEPLKEIFLAR